MAGLIPQSFINDLVARVDIVAIIDERVKLKKAGKNYQGLCPFHDEKSPSFSVSPDKQFYHCFGCGESGTALKFLMEYDRLEFVPAVEALAAIVGVAVPREGGARPNRRVGTELYDVLEGAAKVFRRELKNAPEAIEYLKNRSLTGITARDFGLGFAPDAWDTMMTTLGVTGPDSKGASESELLRAGLLTENDRGRRYDRFRNRVMFPIRDTRGRVIGFGGRVLGAGEPKYLNSPETDVFKKGQELYGLYEARKALRNIDEFFVVEGYMDVIALAQAGIANAVATLGTASGQVHFEMLYRFAPRVTCCFDGDNAGRAAAWKALASALPALKDGCQLRFMFLPDGEDPDSLVNSEGKDGFLRRAAGGVSALDYLFDTLGRGLDLSMPDDQARLAHLAKPLIETVPNGVLKGLLLERLQQQAGRAAVRSVSPNTLATPESAAGSAPLRAPGSAQTTGQSHGGRGSVVAGRQETRRPRRMLMMLLKQPAFGRNLPMADFVALEGLDSLLLDVLRFIRGQTSLEVDTGPKTETDPGADIGMPDIMGYWAGQPEEGLLRELAGQQPLLPPEFSEFCDDARALAAQQVRQLSASKLNEMRSADSAGALAPEQLKDHWSLQKHKT